MQGLHHAKHSRAKHASDVAMAVEVDGAAGVGLRRVEGVVDVGSFPGIVAAKDYLSLLGLFIVVELKIRICEGRSCRLVCGAYDQLEVVSVDLGLKTPDVAVGGKCMYNATWRLVE